MSDIKLCKDCAHFRETGALCGYGQPPMELDYVYGGMMRPDFQMAAQQKKAQDCRKAITGCGINARFFKAKDAHP